MVMAVINTKQGLSHTFMKPCFGFMNYVDQWSDEISERPAGMTDEEYNNIPYESIAPGFETENFKTLHFLAKPDVDDDFFSKYIDKILEAMKSFPQFYDNVQYNGKVTTGGYLRHEFIFPLENVEMQKTIIGAMMLRNVIEYTHWFKTFQLLIDEGFDSSVSFVMANIFYTQAHFSGNTNVSRSTGDETIFYPDARLCDIKLMFDQKLGDVWQGVWGMSDCGYFRDGEAAYDDAPDSPRTGNYKTLNSIMLSTDEEEYKNSKSISEVISEVTGRNEWSELSLKELHNVATIVSKLKNK